jgi:glycosyltransferase involved in cell wall biosynthesis
MGVESRLLARAAGGLHLRCVEDEIPVEPVRVPRPWYPPAVAAVWRGARSAEIVHAHDSHAAALAALVRGANPRLAIVCHRRVSYPPNGVVSQRWKYRCVDRWIAVSSEIAGGLRRAGAIDLRVVPSAVDVDDLRGSFSLETSASLLEELGVGSDHPVVGLFGAFSRQKGHDALVAAAPRILAAAPETVFLCAGEGRLRKRMQRRVRRLGMKRAFRFTGFRRDVLSLMRLCSLVVVPSLDGEGSSAVIKEAVVLGMPVVVSDLPGNVEVLGGAGSVVPVADPDALADAVVRALHSPRHQARAVLRGHRRLESWSPRVMADGVLAAYRGLGASIAFESEAT